jgi:PST family polysaccharide transporter
LDIPSRIKIGAAWLAASRVIVNALGFVSTFVLARLLTPDDFGLVAIAATIFALVTAVTELSLSTALVQHHDPTDDYFHSAFTLNVGRASIIAVALTAMSFPIANIYGDPRLSYIIAAISLGAFISGLSNPKSVVFTRNLNFKAQFISSVFEKVSGLVISVSIAFAFRSYWALVFGMLASQSVAVVVSYVQFPFRPTLSLRRSRELFSFSIWLSASQLVTTLSWRFDQLVIGYVLGRSQLGAYSFGDNLAALPTREITAPLAQTLFPAFSRMAGNLSRLRLAYQKAQTTMSAAALPVGIGFALVARPIVLLAAGQKWVGAILVIQVISVAVALQTMGSTVQAAAMALGKTKLFFQRDIVNLLVRLPFVVGGLFVAGLPGAIYGRAISSTIGTLINMAMVHQLFGLSVFSQIWGNRRTVLASLVMAGACLAVQTLLRHESAIDQVIEIVASVIGGAIVYAATLAVLWQWEGRPAGPEAEILKILSPISNRVRFFLKPPLTGD